MHDCMSTALAIPVKVETAVKPKPTKSEVISALTAIKMGQFSKEQRERSERKEKLESELKLEIPRLLKSKAIPSRVHLGWFDRALDVTCGVYLNFDIKDLPATVMKKLAEYHSVSRPLPEPKEKDVRRKIAASLEGIGTREERVEALMDDPESRKVLEKMLKAIS